MCNQWNRRKYQVCTCDEVFPYNHSNDNEKCCVCRYKFDNVRRKWSNYAKCHECSPSSRCNNKNNGINNPCNYCNNTLDNVKGIFGYAMFNESPDDCGKFPLRCQFETIASIGSLKSKFKDVFGRVVDSVQSEKQTQCCVKKSRRQKRRCSTKSNCCQCCLKDDVNEKQNCCVHFCTCSIEGDNSISSNNCAGMLNNSTNPNMEVCCCQPVSECCQPVSECCQPVSECCQPVSECQPTAECQPAAECTCHQQENSCDSECECGCLFSENENVRKFLAVLLLLIMIAIGYYVDKTLSPCVRRYRLY